LPYRIGPTPEQLGDCWAGDAMPEGHGPGWLQKDQPLVCPASGEWAIDPEAFYDRQTQAWYLLWKQDSGLNIQRRSSNLRTQFVFRQRSEPDLAVGDLVDPGRNLLPRQGLPEQRPTGSGRSSTRYGRRRRQLPTGLRRQGSSDRRRPQADHRPVRQRRAGGVHSVQSGGGWTTVTGPTVSLAAGLNTLRLQVTAGASGWSLNWFTLTRG
jgi:hypothetical protein